VKQADPFIWAIIFTIMLIAIIAGVVMSWGPIYLVLKNPFKGSYILLLLIPIGLWIIWKLVLKLSDMIQTNRYRSSYELESDCVRLFNWDLEGYRQLKETKILFSEMSFAAITMYVLENNQLYSKKQLYEHTPKIAMLPLLNFISDKGSSMKVEHIPFYGDAKLNHWLEVLKDKGIPIYFSEIPLQLDDKNAALDFFRENDWMIPYVFNKSWLIEEEDLRFRWYEEFESKLEAESDLPAYDDGLFTEEELNEQKEMGTASAKQKKRSIRRADLRAIGVILIGLLTSILLLKIDIVSYESYVPGFITMILGAIVYFLTLRDHLEFRHFFKYSIGSVLLTFIILLFTPESKMELYEFTVLFPVTGLFSIIVNWIPFLIIKQVSKHQPNRTL